MNVRIGQSTEPHVDVVLDALTRTARVVHDLGIRAEVSVGRLPGIVDDARIVAESLGLAVTVEIAADEICVRFEPRVAEA
jgi:hypothetical protein